MLKSATLPDLLPCLVADHDGPKGRATETRRRSQRLRFAAENCSAFRQKAAWKSLSQESISARVITRGQAPMRRLMNFQTLQCVNRA
jgi:hypothetical protein